MNVADDCLVHHFSNPRARAIADDQLATIARIDADEQMSDREKCAQLLAIITVPSCQRTKEAYEASSDHSKRRV